MTKVQKVIASLSFFATFQFMCWLFDCYLGHHIGYQMGNPALVSVFTFIPYVLFDLVLVLIFERNQVFLQSSLFDKNRPFLQRYYIIKLPALCIIRIIAAVSMTFVKQENAFWVSSLIISLYWIVVYCISCNKKEAIWHSPKKLLIVLAAFVLIVASKIAVDNLLCSDYSYYLSKYEATSPILQSVHNNISYNYGIVTCVYHFLLSLILLIAHYHSDEDSVRDNDKLKARDFSLVMVKAMCAMWIVGVLFFGRLIITSQGFLLSGAEQSHGSNTVSFGECKGEVEHEYIKTLSVNDKGEYIVCQSKYSQVLTINNKDKDKIEIVIQDMPSQYDVYAKATELKDTFLVVDVSTDSYSACIYNSTAIYYCNAEGSHSVLLEDLNAHKEDPIITDICKKFLEDGNIYIFEYSYQYFLKYDKEFIVPYIDRYAKGDFNSMEAAWMKISHYRSSFVIDLAKSI